MAVEKKKRRYRIVIDKDTREVKEAFVPRNRICVHCDTKFRHPTFGGAFVNTCPECLKNGIVCPHCQTLVRKDKDKKKVGDAVICRSCYDERYAECGHCGIEDDKSKLSLIGKKHYCKKCDAELFATCERCLHKEKKAKLRPYKDDVSTFKHLCEKCYSKAEKYIGRNPLVDVEKSSMAKRLRSKYATRV